MLLFRKSPTRFYVLNLWNYSGAKESTCDIEVCKICRAPKPSLNMPLHYFCTCKNLPRYSRERRFRSFSKLGGHIWMCQVTCYLSLFYIFMIRILQLSQLSQRSATCTVVLVVRIHLSQPFPAFSADSSARTAATTGPRKLEDRRGGDGGRRGRVGRAWRPRGGSGL